MPTAIWGAQQWLRLTKELTWGTFNGTGSTPAGGADVLWIRLMEDAFVLDGDPKRWTIRSADGGNLRTQQGSQRIGFTGSLRTPLYYSQAPKLVPWFATPTGSGSATKLDSWTADYFGGVEVVRSLGVRCTKGVVSSDDTDEGSKVMLALDLIAKDQVSDGSITLTEPAATVFPTERPYNHVDLAGQLSMASGVVVGIESLRVEYNNVVFAKFHESTRIDRANYRGRTVDLHAKLADPTAATRIRFESLTPIAVSAGWLIASPAHSVIFNAQTKVYTGARTMDRKFNQDEYETVTLQAFKDDTSGTDCVATVA